MNYLLTLGNETTAFDTLDLMAQASNGLDADSGQIVKYQVEETDGTVRDLASDEHSELSDLCTFYAENPA